MRKKAYKILQLCMKLTDRGHYTFFSFVPSAHAFVISYSEEFQQEKNPDVTFVFYTDGLDAGCTPDDVISFLEERLQE